MCNRGCFAPVPCKSIVWHSEWLIGIIDEDPEHPFRNIPILHHPELMIELKKLVSIEPSGEIKKASGVPRATKLLKMVIEILTVCKECVSEIKATTAKLPELIKDAINEKAAEAGQVTVPYVMEQLKVATHTITEELTTKVTAAIELATRHISTNRQPAISVQPSTAAVPGPRQLHIGFRDYKYNGRWWAVPERFKFPKSSTLLHAWRAWLLGFGAIGLSARCAR